MNWRRRGRPNAGLPVSSPAHTTGRALPSGCACRCAARAPTVQHLTPPVKLAGVDNLCHAGLQPRMPPPDGSGHDACHRSGAALRPGARAARAVAGPLATRWTSIGVTVELGG